MLSSSRFHFFKFTTWYIYVCKTLYRWTSSPRYRASRCPVQSCLKWLGCCSRLGWDVFCHNWLWGIELHSWTGNAVLVAAVFLRTSETCKTNRNIVNLVATVEEISLHMFFSIAAVQRHTVCGLCAKRAAQRHVWCTNDTGNGTKKLWHTCLKYVIVRHVWPKVSWWYQLDEWYGTNVLDALLCDQDDWNQTYVSDSLNNFLCIGEWFHDVHTVLGTKVWDVHICDFCGVQLSCEARMTLNFATILVLDSTSASLVDAFLHRRSL